MKSRQLTLSPEEQEALTALAAGGRASHARRARIILMTAEGRPQIAIAAALGMSERQVRRWQRSFETQRMEIFPAGGRKGDEPSDKARRSRRRSAQPGPAPAAVSAGDLPTMPLAADQPRRALLLTGKPGVLPDDPMSEAGRKILFYHFERMLLHEPGSRLGQDIEAVHDMRVATRRMRSALRLFVPFYERKIARRLASALRRTGQALGMVRDLDVFIEKAQRYQEELSPGNQDNLALLIEACQTRREDARTALIEYLDSPEYAAFVEDFALFTATPFAGAKKPEEGSPVGFQVRHVVPRLIYTRYEAARAYEVVLNTASVETLHALRIECKQVRYALEFFEEVLGPEIRVAINEVKRVQDHLGDLNDAEVAGYFLRDFINEFETSQTALPLARRRNIEWVVQYMAYQYAQKHRLTTTFPEVWERLVHYDTRRALALAVAAL